jgi:D-3-phosphoglycerate dehydrogenase
LPDAVADLRAGKWSKKEFSKAAGLKGRTLALLGYGNIGREVAVRARAFGMHLSIWSRHLAGTAVDLAALGLDSGPHDLSVRLAASPEDAVDGCDALSIHLALAPETRGLVNAAARAAEAGRVRDQHVARGDRRPGRTRRPPARVAFARRSTSSRRARGGATNFDPIVGVPNVYGTPHIGASTEQAQEAIAAETVRIVRTFKDTARCRTSSTSRRGRRRRAV